MRKHFPGYFTPTHGQFDAMWRDGLFTLDTNVLLNLYRYTVPTRDRLLEILVAIREQLWLTNQVAYEFHRNRLGEISRLEGAYSSITNDLSKSLSEVINRAKNDYPKHPGIDFSQLEAIVHDTSEKVAGLLQEAEGKHPDYWNSDPILNQVEVLFDGKVGDPYTQSDLERKYKEAQGRFDLKQPPGYKDTKKPEPDRYGDVIIWFQLLDQARQVRKPIILITDDGKEDWWYRHNGKTIGPRPELVHEMQAIADVQFYAYPPERFMAQAEDFLGLRRQPEAIDEVREVSQQIMYMEGRDGSIEHGGGWPGIGMYRIRTARNVAAAMQLGIRDPIEIAAFDYDAFRSWALQRGLTSQIAIDHLLGDYESPDGTGGRTPWELRAAVEAQPPGRLAWAEKKAIADFVSIAGLPHGITDVWTLEQKLGRSLQGMTLPEIASEMAKLK